MMKNGGEIFTERGLIDLISRFAGSVTSKQVVRGIGDDCAVIDAGPDTVWLVTVDTLVEGIHFDPSWHPYTLLGRKAASVNISDIAAMGGVPKFALLSLAVSGETDLAAVEDFMTGFSAVLQENNTVLIGGDTVKNKSNVFSITLIGEANKEKILLRSKALPGDSIWVSGGLGEAAAGLELCRRGLVDSREWRPLVMAHLDPEPQVLIGRHLAESGRIYAAIDLSDGLATDLAHLCAASGTGAEIYQQELPCSSLLKSAAAFLQMSLDDLILRGGEDYQLLFTAAPGDDKGIKRLVHEKTGRDIFKIGRMTGKAGVFLAPGRECGAADLRDITFQGYDHFAEPSASGS